MSRSGGSFLYRLVEGGEFFQKKKKKILKKEEEEEAVSLKRRI